MNSYDNLKGLIEHGIIELDPPLFYIPNQPKGKQPFNERKIGAITAYAYADLLIYDGNPLDDIQVIVKYTENLKLIMKDGKIYKNEL